jgi:glycosyltransferase EpsD
MKRALILSTVSGFLHKFEQGNVRLLQDLGYEVHYASNTNDQLHKFDPAWLDVMNIKVHHIEIARSPYMIQMNRKAYKQLIDIINNHNIQFIHCHNPVGGLLGRMVARKTNVQVIYTAHGFHFYRGAPLYRRIVYYLAERIMARFTDALITINEEDYQASRRFSLRKGGKRHYIPGVGLDLEKFKPYSAEEREKNRQEIGISQGVFHLATIGELNDNKYHEVVLQALRIMKRENKRLGEVIRYTIWGDGYYKERLEGEIKGLEDVVTLREYTLDAPKALSTVDALVFPSKREGLGMIALEALAMKIPVIANDNRGTREYMRHKINGYICFNNKPQNYVDGVKFLKNLNLKDKLKLKEECRKSTFDFCKCNTRDIMYDVYSYINQPDRQYDRNLTCTTEHIALKCYRCRNALYLSGEFYLYDKAI